MCLTEYNEELHEKTLRTEGHIRGRAEGRIESKKSDAINMYTYKKASLSITDIATITQTSVQQVKEWLKEAGVL
ncbi:hypothetical protein P261_02779 [Lachnospiraceae bacterium TWA4]|nr:hypothetical protein P261_02779 [Lachnospiraceae bacterium TWA4]